jgi:hypothetical protein
VSIAVGTRRRADVRSASIAVGPEDQPRAPHLSRLSCQLPTNQKPRPRPPRRSVRSIDPFSRDSGEEARFPPPHSDADRFRILAGEPGGPFSVLVAGFSVRVLFSRRRPTGSRLPSSILFCGRFLEFGWIIWVLPPPKLSHESCCDVWAFDWFHLKDGEAVQCSWDGLIILFSSAISSVAHASPTQLFLRELF